MKIINVIGMIALGYSLITAGNRTNDCGGFELCKSLVAVSLQNDLIVIAIFWGAAAVIYRATRSSRQDPRLAVVGASLPRRQAATTVSEAVGQGDHWSIKEKIDAQVAELRTATETAGWEFRIVFESDIEVVYETRKTKGAWRKVSVGPDGARESRG